MSLKTLDFALISVVSGYFLHPRFAGSNPVEVDGFFSGCKNSEHKSSGRDFKSEISGLLKNLKSEKIRL